MTQEAMPSDPPVIQTGVPGLDYVLNGGLVRDRLYLVEGDPGAGKTTLALQFLLEGKGRGERCLFVALSENKEELRASADSHGWSLEGLSILEVLATEGTLGPEARYTMFHPSEVELGETIRTVLAEVERVRPTRLVLDSLSELRLLADTPLRYRRQILALKQHLALQSCTVLILDDLTHDGGDLPVHSVAHGVLSLERRSAEFGVMRRRLQVRKLRGRQFREGYHDFVIRKGGLELFPRLEASAHDPAPFPGESISSGLAPLDALLCGGLTRGTSTLILGSAGTGKSSLATCYLRAAAERGEHATVFLFEEAVRTFLARSAGLGLDVQPFIESGRIRVREINPAELSPGEFAHLVRQSVEREGARLVVIDSLNGYLHAMSSDRYLTLHLHELLTFLGMRGVTTLLVMAQHGLAGAEPRSQVDASYLADAVLLLRYFEARGEVRQAISVIKKRTGRHERTIRQLEFNGTLRVGEPLRDFQGVLTGTPILLDGGRSAEGVSP